MENNNSPSKLDTTIKDTLSNYDAKHDSGDWARMERMLDASPTSIAPKGSYKIALIIGAVVLVGGFLIYKGINSSKKTVETTVAPIEMSIEKTTDSIATTISAAASIVVTTPEVITIVTESKTNVISGDVNTKSLPEKRKKEKKQNISAQDTDFPKNQKVTVMGNEPIFGDMIDSSKGIVRETKEKESTKKAAVKKGSNNIGLSGLLNLNADSILKQKELLKNDTLQK